VTPRRVDYLWEEEPVGIKMLHLDTALRIFHRGNEAGWFKPLVKEVDSLSSSFWARLGDPGWTMTEMSLQYAISVLEPPEQIEVRPGEPFRLALRIVLLVEPTRQEKQKLHEKAYMLLRAGQAFASYLEGPIKGLQIPLDLTNGTVENFAFSLNITQGRDRLQIPRRDVEPFIQNWAYIQRIGEERAAGGPTDENRPEV
jgi:hypothetical protein